MGSGRATEISCSIPLLARRSLRGVRVYRNTSEAAVSSLQTFATSFLLLNLFSAFSSRHPSSSFFLSLFPSLSNSLPPTAIFRSRVAPMEEIMWHLLVSRFLVVEFLRYSLFLSSFLVSLTRSNGLEAPLVLTDYGQTAGWRARAHAQPRTIQQPARTRTRAVASARS